MTEPDLVASLEGLAAYWRAEADTFDAQDEQVGVFWATRGEMARRYAGEVMALLTGACSARSQSASARSGDAG
jgi:hypothetical protein